MKNAIILHGKPSRERYENPEIPKPHRANWLPWLGRELWNHGIPAAIPPLPKPYFPVYKAWRVQFERQKINECTALIGHSAGAEFILRWLSETQEPVERVALVAPYHDFERKYGNFSDYELDPELAQIVGRVTILNSLDDDPPIQKNVERIMTAIPGVNLITFTNHGHFRLGNNMTSEQFPELLQELSK